MTDFKLTLDVWTILLFSSAVIGYFLAVLLFHHKRGNKEANRLLSLLMIVIALLITEYLLFNSGIYVAIGIPLFITTPLIFLIGPLYYLHSNTLIKGKIKLKPTHIFHFLPFILCLINYIDYYLALVSYFAGNKAANFDFIIRINGYAYTGIEILQIAVYVIAVYILFKRYKNNLSFNVNSFELIRTTWLQRLSFVLFVYLLFKSSALFYLILTNYIAQIEYLMTLSLSAILYVIAYSSISLPEILSGSLKNGLVKKYQKSFLSEEQSRSYMEKLRDHMRQNKPYLKPDLKLSDLAANLSISTNHLSQMLNQEAKTSFFDFINYYRIEEVKRRLSNPEFKNFTILSIALECGFNSKTSFNRVFKKSMGMTPSEYSRSIIPQNN